MTMIVRLRVLTPGRLAQSSQSAPRVHSRQPRRVNRAPQFLQKLELLIVGASGSEARGLYLEWQATQCNDLLPRPKRRGCSLIFSPGLRALARYPGTTNYLFSNPERVAGLFVVWLVNSFRVPVTINEGTQGVALGWNLRTPLGVPPK